MGGAGEFRSLEEARALLAAGARRIESFPAGASAGPGWFQAIVERLEAEFPDTEFDVVLDCGEEAGTTLAALRRGVRRVRFSGSREAFRRLSGIAAQLDATLVHD